MKRTLLACLTTLTLVLSTSAAEWRTDFEAAKSEAKKDSKIIVMNFTGSDWCGFCIKMKKDTLDMKAFTDYAAMLDALELDGVLACGPPALHVEVALAAFAVHRRGRVSLAAGAQTKKA